MGRLVTPKPYDPDHPPTWWDRNAIWVLLPGFLILVLLLCWIDHLFF